MDFLKWIVKPKTLVGGVLVTVVSAIAAGYGKGLIFDSIEKPKGDPTSTDDAQKDAEALPGGEDFTEVDNEEKK